jgi:hypothetical protein
MRTASSCQPSVARIPQMLPTAQQRASADVTADSAGVRARLEQPIEGLCHLRAGVVEDRGSVAMMLDLHQGHSQP